MKIERFMRMIECRSGKAGERHRRTVKRSRGGEEEEGADSLGPLSEKRERGAVRARGQEGGGMVADAWDRKCREEKGKRVVRRREKDAGVRH